jgi:Cyclin, N-terminal domain/Cyclin, C-terminal domain
MKWDVQYSVSYTFPIPFSFDLSREVVGVSLNLFDRYLATLKENRTEGNLALLTSLTTLYIAMKLNDVKKVRLDLLANLSRGQFGANDIEAMEWTVLSALNWNVNPPTQYHFIASFLSYLPTDISPAVWKELSEHSRYLCELSVCDSYFVGVNNSTVAFAAILNVMSDMNFSRFPGGLREKFLRDIHEQVGIPYYSESVVNSRQRLRQMFVVTTRDESPTSVTQGTSCYEYDYNNVWDGDDSYCTAMNSGGDNKSIATTESSSSRPGNHRRSLSRSSSNSLESSKGSHNRFSPNPRRRLVAVSPMASATSRAYKSNTSLD